MIPTNSKFITDKYKLRSEDSTFIYEIYSFIRKRLHRYYGLILTKIITKVTPKKTNKTSLNFHHEADKLL